MNTSVVQDVSTPYIMGIMFACKMRIWPIIGGNYTWFYLSCCCLGSCVFSSNWRHLKYKFIRVRCSYYNYIQLQSHRVIQKDWLTWRVNGASTHARQLVAVFQVLSSLYGLPCVGYAQNSLVFVSRSTLIHVVGRSFCLYTDSLFAQIGDSND